MIDTVNMNELCERLNDLKSVFRYGQKMIPIIQNLLDFMKETVPLLENINSSITDSTLKIPKATNQINSVTNATEMATTEILNLVDAISSDVFLIEKAVNTQSEKENRRVEVLKRLIQETTDEQTRKSLQNLLDDEFEKDEFSQLLQLTDTVKNNSYNITLSLQVQDITTQQLSAVNHLIESVQLRLSSLIQNLQESSLDEIGKDKSVYPVSLPFDPHATYCMTDNRQEAADAVINENLRFTSQDEIDKLFSK